MVSNEEKLLKERIRHLLTYKRLSIAKLAENETMRVRLGRQINGPDTSVPYTTLYMLLYMFPDISADWLIMGEGHMLKSEHIAPRVYTQHNEVKGNNAGGDINVGPDTIVTKKTVEDLQAQIERLQSDNEFLKGIVKSITKS